MLIKLQTKEYKKELYSKLEPFQKLQIARHAERPTFLDYINFMTTDFIELKGDRVGVDDRAIIGGIAKIDEQPVMLVGTVKGKSTKENLEYNFGMPQPEGYRKALRLFEHASRFGLPIVTLIDTPGAYPGMKAEETGQGVAIAENLLEMAKEGLGKEKPKALDQYTADVFEKIVEPCSELVRKFDEEIYSDFNIFTISFRFIPFEALINTISSGFMVANK